MICTRDSQSLECLTPGAIDFGYLDGDFVGRKEKNEEGEWDHSSIIGGRSDFNIYLYLLFYSVVVIVMTI